MVNAEGGPTVTACYRCTPPPPGSWGILNSQIGVAVLFLTHRLQGVLKARGFHVLGPGKRQDGSETACVASQHLDF